MLLCQKTAITTGGISDSTERTEIKELGVNLDDGGCLSDGVMWLFRRPLWRRPVL